MKQTRWLIEEDDILRENYKIKTDNELAKMLGRSSVSVYYRRKVLYLKKEDEGKWTEEEDNIIKDNLTKTAFELTIMLPKRTKGTIAFHRRYLGFGTHFSKWTKEDDIFLEQNHKTKTDNELAEILERTVSSIRARKWNLHLYQEPEWSLEDKEKLKNLYPVLTKQELEKEFLEKSYAVLHGMANKLNLFKDKKTLGRIRKEKGERESLWVKDDQKLKDLIGQGLTQKEILLYFPNRTPVSINSRISVLGLRKKKLVRWTNEQLQILRDKFEDSSRKELQKLLPYGWVKIRAKANTLGLYHRAKREKHTNEWTEQENEIVKREVGLGKSDLQIAKILGRSGSAVIDRRQRLGLVKNNVWTSFEDNVLRKNKDSSFEILAKKLGKTTDAIALRRRKLGLSKKMAKISQGGNRVYLEVNDELSLFLKKMGRDKHDYLRGLIEEDMKKRGGK